MEMASGWSTEKDSSKAINEAYAQLKKSISKEPKLLFLYCSANYNAAQLLSELEQVAPQTTIHGGTSCLGVMTEKGFHSNEGQGLGLLGIVDNEGHYGVGHAELTDNPRLASSHATSMALEQSDCIGQVPSMVWMTAAPGAEEDVIKGIQDIVGTDVPITGGSSADNTVSGDWMQFADKQVLTNSVVVTVMFPSSSAMFAFHSGYEPTEKSGIVTSASGRVVNQIDNKPAAEVYNEWADQIIAEDLPDGGNILSKTSLHPLGRIVGDVSGIPYYRLAHPDTVTKDGGLSLFADIEEGEKLVFMSGTKDSLVNRAGRVASASLAAHSTESEEVSGALVVYCAGCMLTVQDRMNDVVNGVKKALGDKPFLGLFTFGEQGCFVGGENRHGNLMISVLTFNK